MTLRASVAATAPAGDRISTTRLRAMNCDVTLTLVAPGSGGEAALAAAAEVFARVERSCTRFDPTSPLMRANAAGEAWYPVPEECFLAVSEAARAHLETSGLFDPRILTALVGLGYDRTLPFESGEVVLPAGRSPSAVPSVLPRPAAPSAPTAPSGADAVPDGPWRPGLDREAWSVAIGRWPIDLGGIGKGLAVRWAAEALEGQGSAFLVEAGGDCALGGHGPDGTGWRVGVEDPFGGGEPVAVLELADTSCATSSIRKRTWRREGEQGRLHHLVDPRTGTSAAGGLRSVTVVDPDPARAEVWTKVCLVTGADGVRRLAAQRDLAAFWVDDEGRLGMSDGMAEHVMWAARDVD